MFKMIATTAAIACAGCATVAETMEKEPSAEFSAPMSAAAYRDCFVRSQEIQEYVITPEGEGYLFTHMKAPGQVIRALPGATGTSVTVWGFAGTRTAARRCL